MIPTRDSFKKEIQHIVRQQNRKVINDTREDVFKNRDAKLQPVNMENRQVRTK